MRKVLAMLLAAMMLTAMFAGCGDQKTETKGQGDKQQQEQTDDSFQKIKDKGVFVLGFDENFPPMGFKEGSEYTGFDIELARALFQRLGIELKLQPIDWKANIMELNSGNVHCLWNGLTITEDRKKEIIFSEPYLKNEQVVVVMDSSPVRFR